MHAIITMNASASTNEAPSGMTGSHGSGRTLRTPAPKSPVTLKAIAATPASTAERKPSVFLISRGSREGRDRPALRDHAPKDDRVNEQRDEREGAHVDREQDDRADRPNEERRGPPAGGDEQPPKGEAGDDERERGDPCGDEGDCWLRVRGHLVRREDADEGLDDRARLLPERPDHPTALVRRTAWDEECGRTVPGEEDKKCCGDPKHRDPPGPNSALARAWPTRR